MGCEITQGRTRTCERNVGGFANFFYIGNWKELDPSLQNSDITTALNALTFTDSYAGLYKVETTIQRGLQPVETALENGTTGINIGFNQTVTVHLDAVKQADLAYINELYKAEPTYLLLPSNNGTVYGYGFNNGGIFRQGTHDGGLAIEGSSPQDVLTWIAESEKAKRLEFFDTDYGTTIATLDSYLAS